MKVLIVDDDREVRTLGLLSLRRAPGWMALAAADGPSALEIAERECPQVILLDVQMPGMDGLKTLAALQKKASTSAIPVVFLTAQADDRDIARYRQLGARGVIRKPFPPLDLPDLLLAALGPVS
ncbi:MAG TPA: response regulator [Nannocystis exedens]|nr:response regulator [Nannocystis exedens]